jgi:hypothetical protein
MQTILMASFSVAAAVTVAKMGQELLGFLNEASTALASLPL